MNVVDSCGWLEASVASPLGAVYLDVLRDGAALVVPSICVHEVFRIVARQRGEVAAMSHAARMRSSFVAPLDDGLAVAAARLGLAHGLPCADSIIYATARRHEATLWTHDAHFRDLPGVRFVEAPSD